MQPTCKPCVHLLGSLWFLIVVFAGCSEDPLPPYPSNIHPEDVSINGKTYTFLGYRYDMIDGKKIVHQGTLASDHTVTINEEKYTFLEDSDIFFYKSNQSIKGGTLAKKIDITLQETNYRLKSHSTISFHSNGYPSRVSLSGTHRLTVKENTFDVTDIFGFHEDGSPQNHFLNKHYANIRIGNLLYTLSWFVYYDTQGNIIRGHLGDEHIVKIGDESYTFTYGHIRFYSTGAIERGYLSFDHSDKNHPPGVSTGIIPDFDMTEDYSFYNTDDSLIPKSP